MRVNIDRLRSWMLALAGLVVAGVLLFFGYARWQIHHIGRDLPEKLGVSIQQATEGFTYSKSDGVHTLFTLHAAKTVQYKSGGRAELHDVSITLYGPGGAPADRIYGNDFEYDPANNIVRANGPVQIDLEGPAPHSNTAQPPAAAGESDSRNVVHVRTAGLVFNQKTGMAGTSQPIEFHIADAAGSGIGANFDSRKGVLILDRDVAFESSLGGRPLVVHARHARFDRASRQLYLLMAVTDYQYSRSSSDEATVYFRPDDSAFRIKARGHVTMSTGAQKITSQDALADLDAKSRPEQVILDGGVSYVARNEMRQLQGTASAGTLLFGPETVVRHAQLRNAVSIVDQERDQESARDTGGKAANVQKNGGDRPARVPGSRVAASTNSGSRIPELTTRAVNAAQVDVDFAQASNRQSIARNVLAQGGARLAIRTLYAGAPPQETDVQGDQLFATLRDGVSLSSLRGTGHTKLVRISQTGVKQTGTADHLWMTFAPPSGSGATAKRGNSSETQQAAQLESVEQKGHVVLIEQSPARQGSRPPAANRAVIPPPRQMPVETMATAGQAVYEAASQMIHLFGSPRLRDANGELTASTIAFDRGTGNAEAEGGVKATYRASPGQPATGLGGSEPVHIVADHAHLDHAKDLSTFYGNAHGDARLWQGADSISAPVIELAHAQRTMDAYGQSPPAAKTNGSNGVSAVLSSVASPAGPLAPAGPKSSAPDKPGQVSVVRVTSRTLHYSDAEAKAVFRGGVVARNSSGTMHSIQMDVYFTPAAPVEDGVAPEAAAGAAPAKQTARQVERIVAQGDVQLDQPSRKATGSELVYTAANGRFLLTGSRSAPPRLVDQIHGTVTGESLIFNDRDDSVRVSGGQSRAVTETRMVAK